MNIAADDADAPVRVAAFAQGLQEAGWIDRPQRADRVPLERRRSRSHPAHTRRNLVALAGTSSSLPAGAHAAAVQQAATTVPIVFHGR